MKRFVLLIFAMLLLGAIILICALFLTQENRGTTLEQRSEIRSGKKHGKSKQWAEARSTGKKPMVRPARRVRDGNKPSFNRTTAEMFKFALKAAQANDDKNGVFALAAKAANTDNVEIRGLAVEALAWYGGEAIPELLPFLLDEEQKIVNEAFVKVDQALDGIDSSTEKVKVIEFAMKYANDEDQVVSFLSKFEGVNPVVGIATQSRMIEEEPEDTVLGELFREEYEFITGRPYVNRAEAMRTAKSMHYRERHNSN